MRRRLGAACVYIVRFPKGQNGPTLSYNGALGEPFCPERVLDALVAASLTSSTRQPLRARRNVEIALRKTANGPYRSFVDTLTLQQISLARPSRTRHARRRSSRWKGQSFIDLVCPARSVLRSSVTFRVRCFFSLNDLRLLQVFARATGGRQLVTSKVFARVVARTEMLRLCSLGIERV